MIFYSGWRAKLPHVVTLLSKSRYGDAVTYLSSPLTGTEFKQNSWYVSKVGNKEIGTIQTDWLSDKAVQTPLTSDMSGP